MDLIVKATLVSVSVIGLTLIFRRAWRNISPPKPWPRRFPSGCKY